MGKKQDKSFGDYLVGKATGARYNFWSSVGADYHKRPMSSSRTSAPRPAPPTGAAAVEFSPEDLQSLYWRHANRPVVEAKAPLFKRLAGHVPTFFHANGAPAVALASLYITGLVPASEHRRRLGESYRLFWENERANQGAISDSRTGEATFRLEHLARGRLISPVSTNGKDLRLGTFDVKSGFFGTRTITHRLWDVSIDEYDRRLKLFLTTIFAPSMYPRSFYGGRIPYHSLATDGADPIRFFFRHPSQRRRDK